MPETLINKNQTGEGIWTEDNLVAGGNIEFSVPQGEPIYKVIGDVDITDGVASNFSTSGAIIPAYQFNPQTATTWEWEFKGTYSTAATTQRVCGAANNTTLAQMAIGIDSHKLITWLSSSGTSWDVASGTTGSTTLQDNTIYYIKAEFTGTEYIISLKTENGEYSPEITVSSSTKLFDNSSSFYIGMAEFSQYWRGSMYIEECSLKVDGQKVWSGKEEEASDEPYQISTKDTYNRVNLIAGNKISITEVNQPVIDSNTLGVWHFEGNLLNSSVYSGQALAANASKFSTSTSFSKFGTGSVRWYTTTNSSTQSALGFMYVNSLSDFTIDFWVRTLGSTISDASYREIYTYSSGFHFYIYKNKIAFGSTSNYVTVQDSSWYHVAFEREGSNGRYYVNGALVYTASVSSPNALDIRISKSSSPGDLYMDEIRLSKVARYLGQNFTPFSVPYSSEEQATKWQINNTQDVSNKLENTATGANSTTIVGTATASDYATNVGDTSAVTGANGTSYGYNTSATTQATAIGSTAKATSTGSTALGYNAQAKATGAIQIGEGTNNKESTVKIKNTVILNRAGEIPPASVSGISWTQSTLVAGDNITLTQPSYPAIDEHTVYVYHLNNDLDNAVENSTVGSFSAGSITKIFSSSAKFGSNSLFVPLTQGYPRSIIGAQTTGVGTGDYSWDLWLKIFGTGGFTIGLIYGYGSQANSFEIQSSGTEIKITGDTTPTSVSVNMNQWYHLAYERYNTTTHNFYIDGDLKATFQKSSAVNIDTTTYTSNGTIYVRGLSISSNNGSLTNLPQNAAIDEIRFSNIARWQGQNFTPNTQPYGGSSQYRISTDFTGVTGYNASATQVLKNVNGVLTWVDE